MATIIKTAQPPEYCPSCSTELDSEGRCPACWGDVFGSCETCGEILDEDGECDYCDNHIEQPNNQGALKRSREVKIEDLNSQSIKFSPGGMTITLDQFGQYIGNFFILGGSGSKRLTPKEVAAYLIEAKDYDAVKLNLNILGWDDVKDAFSSLIEKDLGR